MSCASHFAENSSDSGIDHWFWAPHPSVAMNTRYTHHQDLAVLQNAIHILPGVIPDDQSDYAH